MSGATIFGCEGRVLSGSEISFFRESDPWGFIVFARNVESPDQLCRLTNDLRAAVGRDAPVFVDQEGGRVQRLRAPHWAEWLPPLDAITRAVATGGLDAAERMMYLRARLIAAELAAVGIDGNCAPCADLLTDATHPFLRNRCYSDRVAEVVALSRATARGHLEGGVLPVIKHLPGHGRANADTHLHLPTVNVAKLDLQSSDFAVFKALQDLPLAMTAHIVFSAYDDRPATCSPKMINVIREDIGFTGLLMTDDLNMQALQGSLAQKTAAALAAGCDIALHCKGDLSEMAEVAAAAGQMTRDAALRASAALEARRLPDAVDLVALQAEHDALLGADHG